MAAALAYYAAFSLPALLVVVLYAAGAMFGRALAAGQVEYSVTSLMDPKLAPVVEQVLRTAAENPARGVLATVLGAAGLLFSATTAFVQLQEAMNRAWGVEPAQSGWKAFARKRFTSFLMVVGVAVLALASLAAAAAISALGGIPRVPLPLGVLDAGQAALSWMVFTLLFGLLFKVLPDADLDWKDVRAGAMLTAALFVAGRFFIALYLAHGTANPYGAAGSAAVLLLWTYFSALIVLFGIEFTQVWARAHGRSILPERGAVWTSKRTGPLRAA